MGSGGCFYNIKKNFPELRHVLSLNGDLVLDINKKFIENCFKEYIENEVDIGILSARVENLFEGNRLLVESNFQKDYQRKKQHSDFFWDVYRQLKQIRQKV